MTDTMDCAQARISLGVYVLGALEPAERAAVDTHLATCEGCRAELADIGDDMCRQDDGDVGTDRAEQVQEAVALGGIESSGGFIYYDETRICEQGLSDAEALLHAA